MTIDEGSLRTLLTKYLSSMGKVSIDQTVYPQQKVDVVVKKDSEVWAIEAKAGGNIFDALSRAATLRTSPDVDEVFLAIPKSMFNDDIGYFSGNLQVGLILVSENGIEIPARYGRADMRMYVTTSLPQEVSAASTFNLGLTVLNTGQKALLKTRGMIVEAFPFKIHTGTSPILELGDLFPGRSANGFLIIETFPNAKPQIYPLLVKVESYRAPPYRTVVNANMA